MSRLFSRSLFARFKPRSYDLIQAPHQVSSTRTVPPEIIRPPYALAVNPIPPTSTDIGEVPILSQEEQLKLKAACSITKKALDFAGTLVVPGVTTDHIDELLHDFIVQHGAYPSPLGYLGFPKSICTSVNNIICHGIPDSRPLKDGDIISIDVTSYLDGFHGDSCRTFAVGTVDAAGHELIASALECLESAIKLCGPGVPYSEIGKVISATAKSRKHSVCKQFIGHGVGRVFHCPPQIYHYETPFQDVMSAWTAFTIEPCINEHGGGMFIMGDGWSAATADGGRAAQFEHTILVTDSGCEILTA